MEIVYHNGKCEDNIDGGNLGYLVERKTVPDISCYLLNKSDSALNLWDVSIFNCDIDHGSSFHMLVYHTF